MIEEIEYVQAELQLYIFAHGKFIQESCIQVVEPRPGHNVAARIAVGERSGQRKAGRVEPFRRRFRTAVGIAS